MIALFRKRILLALLALSAGLVRRWWKRRAESPDQALGALQPEAATP